LGFAWQAPRLLGKADLSSGTILNFYANSVSKS